MAIAFVFFVLLSPLWGYGLWWIISEILNPDPREGIDWPLVSLGFLLLLVGLGTPAVIVLAENREEAFMAGCAAKGQSPEECHIRWYGERHRH